ncbi:MAG: hypothetical protein H6600_04890 [Flavobacteriales bacterium]|nr:hypothetical protein [Flavobacteriales bacterium]MCB9197773.1 hypothetical protein [Flavobacteriales bacterium]
MIRLLLYLFLSGLFLSCTETGSMQNETTESTVEKKELITPTDHLIDLCDFVKIHSFDKDLPVHLVSEYFNIQSTYIDSISIANTVLKRQFFTNEKLVTAMKFSVYTDSLGMEDTQPQIDLLIIDLENKFGKPFKSTLFTKYWAYNKTEISLKIFPEEGIDLVISTSDQQEQNTVCVGDWFAAKEKLNETINSLISDYTSVQNFQQSFSGVSINYSNHEAILQYECTVSQKLIELDKKGLITNLNKILGKSPIEKDGMLFWQLSELQIQLTFLESGFSVKFIN